MHSPLSTGPTALFPKDFVWGVATSAFQIEGASDADGKGPSIWDTFCKVPGAIADHSDGAVACEHYARCTDDLDLIAHLGVNAYRFSTSWPRVQPTGSGAWNNKGLDFYERLVDGLLARGIAPYLTLNHWDLPEALQAQGGWANRDTVKHFVDYALGMHARLGDRVASIATHNEPWVMSVLGHETGIFAPGIKHRGTAMQVAHHLMLSHGMALRALREAGCKASLGIVLNLSPIEPATDSVADHAKARLEDGRLVRWYMDPLFKGAYPADVVEHLEADCPAVQPGDMEIIRTPMDFLGINYYSRTVASAAEPWDVHKSGLEVTDMDWEVYPQGLTNLLLRLHQDYPVPAMFITENGGAFKDPAINGQVHDADRTRYLQTHIEAVHNAMAQGVNMAGYMVWSLMDNFEWASGYAKRFGIVHVDYATQKRTPKDSAHWYRSFLAAQAASHLANAA
ncbi:MAG: GH1 family beta-glucosidase [Rhodoferax sp.]|nr:GH1 family beta-glucosidase [Rhodoferax sp.]